MKLTINGQNKQFTPPLTISGLLSELELEAERVVVELNKTILALDKHTDTILNDGDSLEIIQFVGGG